MLTRCGDRPAARRHRVATALVAQTPKAVAETKAFDRSGSTGSSPPSRTASSPPPSCRRSCAATRSDGIFVRLKDGSRNVEESVARRWTRREFNRVVQGGASAYDESADAQIQAAIASGKTTTQVLAMRHMLDDARDGSVDAAQARHPLSLGYEECFNTAVALAQAQKEKNTATDKGTFIEKFYGDTVEETAKNGEGRGRRRREGAGAADPGQQREDDRGGQAAGVRRRYRHRHRRDGHRHPRRRHDVDRPRPAQPERRRASTSR